MARHKHKPRKPALPVVTFYMGDPEDALCHHAYYRSITDAFMLTEWKIDLQNRSREYLFIYRNLDLVAVYHWDATYQLWSIENLFRSGSMHVHLFAKDLEYWARKIWGQP